MFFWALSPFDLLKIISLTVYNFYFIPINGLHTPQTNESTVKRQIELPRK